MIKCIKHWRKKNQKTGFLEKVIIIFLPNTSNPWFRARNRIASSVFENLIAHECFYLGSSMNLKILLNILLVFYYFKILKHIFKASYIHHFIWKIHDKNCIIRGSCNIGVFWLIPVGLFRSYKAFLIDLFNYIS